jgi:hypothetical protein
VQYGLLQSYGDVSEIAASWCEQTLRRLKISPLFLNRFVDAIVLHKLLKRALPSINGTSAHQQPPHSAKVDEVQVGAYAAYHFHRALSNDTESSIVDGVEFLACVHTP